MWPSVCMSDCLSVCLLGNLFSPFFRSFKNKNKVHRLSRRCPHISVQPLGRTRPTCYFMWFFYLCFVEIMLACTHETHSWSRAMTSEKGWNFIQTTTARVKVMWDSEQGERLESESKRVYVDDNIIMREVLNAYGFGVGRCSRTWCASSL